MVCPTCHSENPEGKSFCGDCGTTLQKSAVEAAIQHEVERVLSSKLKEQKSVELETSQAIVARLADWAKLFGFFVGIPLTLLFAVLGFLGLKTYSDFSSRVNKAREEALRPLDSTKEEAKRIAQAYKDLDAQLQATRQLAGQVQDLSEKVTRIEQAVKFKPSTALTPELKQNLGLIFRNYYVYLKGVGFALTQNPPIAIVDPSVQENTYYQPPPANQIVMSPDFAKFKDAGLREYTYYVLNAVRPGSFEIPRLGGLESGLADYFPCSFSGQSDFGKEIFDYMRKRYPEAKMPPRNLYNHRSFTEIDPSKTELHDEGNVWGGAFWQLRQSIGKDVADKLLFVAWKGFDSTLFKSDVTVFPREVLEQDSNQYSGVHIEKIRVAFEERGLKL